VKVSVVAATVAGGNRPDSRRATATTVIEKLARARATPLPPHMTP
jgi:hypothetical protein